MSGKSIFIQAIGLKSVDIGKQEKLCKINAFRAAGKQVSSTELNNQAKRDAAIKVTSLFAFQRRFSPQQNGETETPLFLCPHVTQ